VQSVTLAHSYFLAAARLILFDVNYVVYFLKLLGYTSHSWTHIVNMTAIHDL